MTKYHVSADGNPRACKAKPGNCKFGADIQHFENKEDARAYYEGDQAQRDALVAANVSKKNKKDYERKNFEPTDPPPKPPTLTNAKSLDVDGPKKEQYLDLTSEQIASGEENLQQTINNTKNFMSDPKNLTIAIREGFASASSLNQLSEKEQEELAYNTHVTKYREEFLKNGNSKTKRALAQNPYLTSNESAILAQDKDNTIKEIIARHSSLLYKDLEKLANSEDYRVRMNCIDNEGITSKEKEKLLELLSQDEAPQVRGAVARDWNISQQTAYKMVATEQDSMVRKGLAMNETIAEYYPDLIRKLANDKTEEVSFEAQQTIKIFKL